MLGLLAAVASFNAPTTMVGQSAVSSVARTDVSMSTKYTVAAGIAKKKNPKTGDSSNLKGYTVGSRAPDMAKNSGTTKAEQSIFECAAPHLRRSSHAPTPPGLRKPVPVLAYPPCFPTTPPPTPLFTHAHLLARSCSPRFARPSVQRAPCSALAASCSARRPPRT